jgi:alpha-amylase/alpha-mannosidase (GH57 family)
VFEYIVVVVGPSADEPLHVEPIKVEEFFDAHAAAAEIAKRHPGATGYEVWEQGKRVGWARLPTSRRRPDA